jgi:hypothetical protein
MMVAADRIRALTRQQAQEHAPAPTMETDGISLLREWAAEARTQRQCCGDLTVIFAL